MILAASEIESIVAPDFEGEALAGLPFFEWCVCERGENVRFAALCQTESAIFRTCAVTPDLMGIGENIRAAIGKIGGVDAAVAKTGLKRRTLYDWINEASEPRASQLMQISALSGVSLDALLGVPSGSLVPTDAVRLPRYDIQASAGAGAVALAEDIQDFMSVSREWLSRYVSPSSRIGIIETRGDSMEPTIRDGDILMVTHDIDDDGVAGGGIFVISVEGHLMVKRLQRRLNGDMQIVSDNKHYENETIPADQLAHKLIIHARVFWHGGPIR